jgi:hypothetical protein
MNQDTDPNFIHFPTPSDAVPRGANGQAAVAAGMGAAAPDPAETPANGGAKRGRPTDYAPRVIDMLCDSIRRFGLSDSAAAEQQGMSTSTLSRWKQLFPEIGIKLKQARQEIRTFHLQRIMDQAAAEDGKGCRASMWILERLFPGDYSPRMKERHAYLNLEDRLRDKEAHEALDEQLRELHEMQAEERAARAAAQAAQAAADIPSGVAPTAAGDCRRDAEALNEEAEPENCASASERDSHYSRNAGAPEPIEESERSGAEAPANAEEGNSGRGRPSTTLRTCGPDSLDEAAEASCVYSETDSHNSRNSEDAEPELSEEAAGVAPPEAACQSKESGRPGSLNEATHAQASLSHSESDSVPPGFLT